MLRPLLNLLNCTHSSCAPPLYEWSRLSLPFSPFWNEKATLLSLPVWLDREYMSIDLHSQKKTRKREGEEKRKRKLHSCSLSDFITPWGTCSISSRKFCLYPFLSASQPLLAPAGYQLLAGLYQPRLKHPIEPKPLVYPSPTPLCLLS